MAKKVIGFAKLQILGGRANPAPPVGPALGQHGVNIMEFCKQFNHRTQADAGTLIPVEITVYADRSFSFITKTPPVSFLILKALGIEKGSAKPHADKVAKLTQDQLKEIAGVKLRDLNTTDVSAAMKMVAGTARSMGIEVHGEIEA